MYSVPLEKKYTNFMYHPWFIPIMYNVALHSTYINNDYYYIGEESVFYVNNIFDKSDNAVHLISVDGREDVIPEQRKISSSIMLFLHSCNLKSSNYYITYGKDTLSGLSLNYNRTESVLNYESWNDIINKAGMFRNIYKIDTSLSTFSDYIKKINNEGILLWKYFIFGGLLCLLIEMLLLRFYMK